MTSRCAWCGQFARSDAEPLAFRDALGDPTVTRGPLCPPCEDSCRDMAARNLLRAPSEPYLRSMRDQYGWPS